MKRRILQNNSVLVILQEYRLLRKIPSIHILKQGLKHLTYLENLNLYFNHISSLSEMLRLHSLTALQVVDFRLNPVVKNESDYRLFVVHMLPNLKQLGKLACCIYLLLVRWPDYGLFKLEILTIYPQFEWFQQVQLICWFQVVAGDSDRGSSHFFFWWVRFACNRCKIHNCINSWRKLDQRKSRCTNH